MATWGYGFYLVLKVSLTRSLRSFVISPPEDKIRVRARPCNILYIFSRKLFFRNSRAVYFEVT